MDARVRQQMLVLLTGAALALLILERVVLTPLFHAWTERSKTIATLKKSVAEGQLALLNEASFRSRWHSMQTNMLPDNVSVAENELFRAFDRWAQTSRLKRVSLRPQWKPGGEDFMTLECRADVTGSLEAVTRFLFEIEKDPMPIRIEHIELASRDADGAQIALGLQVSALQTPAAAK